MSQRRARQTTLSDVAKLCGADSRLALFAKYCELKDRGLRRQALNEIDAFIRELTSLSDDDRFEIVNRIFEIDDEAQLYNLLPHPLVVEIMNPACEARKLGCGNDPRPYRWLGFEENWRKALQLDPGDAITRRRWSKALWKDLDHALHELPAGVLGAVGDIAQCVFDLDQLSRGAGGISFWKESWLRALACSYLDYARSGERVSFAEWAARNGRPSSAADF